MSSTPATLDERGVRWFRGTLPHPGALNLAMATLSKLTDHSDGWMVLGLGGALLDRQRRGPWLRATGQIAVVELTARAMKRAIPRDRPNLEGLPHLATTPSPRSFPSSHTAAAVAAIGAFDGLVPQWILRDVAAVSVFSRLYLGVHFPSDVAVGAALGWVFGRAD